MRKTNVHWTGKGTAWADRVGRELGPPIPQAFLWILEIEGAQLNTCFISGLCHMRHAYLDCASVDLSLMVYGWFANLSAFMRPQHAHLSNWRPISQAVRRIHLYMWPRLGHHRCHVKGHPHLSTDRCMTWTQGLQEPSGQHTAKWGEEGARIVPKACCGWGTPLPNP